MVTSAKTNSQLRAHRRDQRQLIAAERQHLYLDAAHRKPLACPGELENDANLETLLSPTTDGHSVLARLCDPLADRSTWHGAVTEPERRRVADSHELRQRGPGFDVVCPDIEAAVTPSARFLALRGGAFPYAPAF